MSRRQALNPSECFAQTYAEARGKFVDAAGLAGARVDSVIHPLKGRQNEELAIDIVRFGVLDAKRLLVISSGCHGVEGFAGSGVQVALLQERDFQERARASGVALLYLHALNPWGFSWWRRWTEDNVDLNRNFQDFGAGVPLPDNPGYVAIADALVPDTWPSEAADRVLWDYVGVHGMRGIEVAIASGQYTHPGGLFFGGHAPTWSHDAVRRIVRQHRGRCEQVAWLDLHTATGPKGAPTMVLAAPEDPETLVRARAWWGDDVASFDAPAGPMVSRKGTMADGLRAEFTGSEYTNVVLEFGTEDGVEVLMALRAGQWLDRQERLDPLLLRSIDRRVRDAFYTDTDAWKASTVGQGCKAAYRALAGLVGVS
jgi:hypothetical protein